MIINFDVPNFRIFTETYYTKQQLNKSADETKSKFTKTTNCTNIKRRKL